LGANPISEDSNDSIDSFEKRAPKSLSSISMKRKEFVSIFDRLDPAESVDSSFAFDSDNLILEEEEEAVPFTEFESYKRI
jgi:hypothetical protein